MKSVERAVHTSWSKLSNTPPKIKPKPNLTFQVGKFCLDYLPFSLGICNFYWFIFIFSTKTNTFPNSVMFQNIVRFFGIQTSISVPLINLYYFYFSIILLSLKANRVNWGFWSLLCLPVNYIYIRCWELGMWIHHTCNSQALEVWGRRFAVSSKPAWDTKWVPVSISFKSKKGAGNGLMVKSVYYSCRGPKFSFQHSHQVAHKSPAPGYSVPSSGLHGHPYIHAHACMKVHTHTLKTSFAGSGSCLVLLWCFFYSL